MNKKVLFSLFFVSLFCFGIIGCTPIENSYEKGFISQSEINSGTENQTNSEIQNNQSENADMGNGVSAHGRLKAVGGKILDKNGKSFILQGMSSHGIVWFPEFTNKYSIQKTKEYGANVFRLAMYTEEYGGYTTGENERKNSESILYSAIENALSLDMYVIVDWHILNDNNPQKHKSEAIDFFQKISEKYSGNPAIIYEICNEPHNVSWENDIKPYAEEIITIIRKNDPNALIIVGSNTWSQDVDEASEKPLDFENIAYSFHFYSGTHKLDNFKPKIEKALANGLTIFVTEWGTSDASGNNGNYFDEAKKWLDFLNQKEISRVNWSLCNKNESSAALIQSANPENWTENDLSQSGKFIFENLKI